MSSVGSEHRGNWNFVGRDVVVLHRLPDSAYCPAGAAADAFVRSAAGLRHIVDHDQPRDPVRLERVMQADPSGCTQRRTNVFFRKALAWTCRQLSPSLI